MLPMKLNRASEKVTDIRVQIAKTDFLVEYLQTEVLQKKEEILSIENEITILKAKQQGIKEIMNTVQDELEKRLTLLFELHKKEEKGTMPVATAQCQETKVG
ncbi:hypothetical protein [Dehalobacter sp. TeCB1]|uniref:hypothetical protein n=1 Tax=Dehalobacter sp. TeCB1 TaxID=1843715 RepID=UPI00083B9AD7|nr:hypothetical protein [Dehalobacter sp. TeCB1]OCZ53820.1 hypothetical protein A7D23_07615 [Dehalobacter sp. TeCB1]